MAEKVLISIKVDSSEAQTKISKIKTSTDLYAQSLDNLTESEINSLVAEQKLNIQRKQTKLQIQDLAAAQMKSANANKSARAQSGLNNAILLETGRLASDASFGFTAIANNLSQVISLTQSFVRTNGSAVESFKQLRDSLLGAGGVMIGIQLLISFMPKIIKLFSDSSKEVSKFQKELDQATLNLDNQILLFQRLTDNITKYGESTERAKDTNRLLADSFSTFKKSMEAIDEGAILTYMTSFGEEVPLKGEAAMKRLRKSTLALLRVRREIAIVTTRLNQKDEEGNYILLQNSFDRNKAEGNYIELLRQKLALEEEINVSVEKNKEQEKERAKVIALLNDFLVPDAADIVADRRKVNKALKGVSKERLLDQAKEGRERELLQLDLDHSLRMMQLESANATSQDLLAAQEDYFKKRADLIGKYNNDELKKKNDFDRKSKARLERTLLAERQSRIDHLQSMLSALSGFLQNSAELNEQNKALAKASIIASAAAASVGVWEAWLVKDKTFNPAPVKVAGAIATQGAIIASTISALKSLNSEQPITGEGSGPSAQVYAPDFNVVGASPINQLAGVASRSLGGDNAPVAVVSLNSLNVKQGQLNRIIETAGT